MKRIALLLNLSLFLFSTQSKAGDETKSVRINNPVKNSFLIVKDDKFVPIGQPVSVPSSGGFVTVSNLPWYSAFSTCNFSSKSVFEFGLDETLKYYHGSAFTTILTFDAVAFDKDNLPTYYTGLQLQINYDPAKGSSYTDKASWVLSNIYFLDVTVTNIVTTQGSVIVPSPLDLYIEGRIQSSRDYQLEQFSNVKANLFGKRFLSASNEVELFWPTLIGAEEYELEWCWVPSYSAMIVNPQYNFRKDATRIITKNNFYRIPLLYEAGHMIFRVRPIGRNCSDNTRSRLEGSWNTDILGIPEKGYVWVVNSSNSNLTYVNSKFENDKFNWSSNLTFDENGRQGSGVTLSDALLKPHYSIAKLNTENNIITSSQLYDFQGRPAVAILPVPIQKADISYIPDLNKTTTLAQFDKNSFDVDGAGGCTNPVTPQVSNLANGASTYYSSNVGSAGLHSNKEGAQAYLPDAAQYPYIRTEYTQDNTGRIRSQSLPGETHKLGSGKETKVYYANPGSRELDRLFGTEVGNSSHYKKTITKDANGQLSVNYTDMLDRTIATALAGPSPSQVDALPSHAASAVNLTDNFIPKTLSSPYERVVNSSIFIDQAPVTQQFIYEFTPRNVNHNCPQSSPLCFSCIYEIELSIKDECGNELVDLNPSQPQKQISKIVGTIEDPGTCNSPIKFSLPASDINITFPNPGNYFITKKLKVSEINVDEYWGLYKSLCYEDLATLISQQTALIDDDLCGAASCAACTTAVNKYVTDHPGVLNSEQVSKLIADCLEDCENDPCESYRARMLSDLTPNTNPAGQYALGNSSSQVLSIWGGAGGLVDYHNVTFHDADGSVSKVVNSLKQTLPANQLSIADFIANFQPSWAEDLLPYHPEYCYLEFCQNNKASLLYDEAMQNVETWSEACTAGFLRPMGASNAGCINSTCPSCATSNPDPFFVSGGGSSIASIMLSELTGNYNSNSTFAVTMSNSVASYLYSLNPSGGSVNVNTSTTNGCAYQLAADIAVGSSPVNAYCTGVDAVHQDNVWKAFRMLYLSKKAKMYEVKRRDNATAKGCLNTCIGSGSTAQSVTYANTCLTTIPAGKSGNCNGSSGYNPTLDPTAPCSACGNCSPQFNAYKTKQRIFPDNTDILISGPQTYVTTTSGSNAPNPLISSSANSYLGNCTAMADSWMQKLVDCTIANYPGNSLNLSTNTILYNTIKNNLIAVCAYGSSAQNPLGVSEINPNGSGYNTTPSPVINFPTSYNANNASSAAHFNSFDEVFKAYVTGPPPNSSYPSPPYPGCPASDLISFPQPQDANSYMNRPLDPCACTQIMNNQYYFTQMQTINSAPMILPSGVTDAASLWNYYSINGVPKTIWSTYTYPWAAIYPYDFQRPALTNYNQLYSVCASEYTGVWNPTTSYYTLDAKYNVIYPNPFEKYHLEVPNSINCDYSDSHFAAPRKHIPLVDNKSTETFVAILPSSTSCYDDMLEQAITNAFALFDAQIKNKEKFIRYYKGNCIGSALNDEKFERNYTLNEHHYTLYYYDQAGNLTRTIPPQGVSPITSSSDFTAIDAYRNGGSTPVFPAHTYPSNYKYMSYNSPESNTNPDEDNKTEYIYDYAGRILASWNSNQKNISAQVFSYSLYDELNRITEVGQINGVGTANPLNFTTLQSQIPTQTSYFTPTAWSNLLVGRTKKQVVKTFYDLPAPASVQWYFTGGQKNLRNRVSFIQYADNGVAYDHATYFSYDPHGNVTEVVQEVAHQFKKMEYEYDLVSGNVNKVSYQKACKDQLIHKYVYDDDNRLHEVFTSKNGIDFDRDAKYFYYKHGPLARLELGDKKINGLDYAYTIHGWLKGVNSSILKPDKDMGKDGLSSSVYVAGKPDLHSIFANDAAGFVLNYYDSQTNPNAKDYLGIRAQTTGYVFTSNEANLRTGSNAFFDLSTDAPNLYNGNITSMVSSYLNQNPASIAGIDAPAPQITAYKYDQLNRIKKMKAFRDIVLNSASGNYNTWNVPSGSNYDGSYAQQLSYDNNGNILTMSKNGATALVASGMGGLAMDNMTYYYNTPSSGKKTNRLIGINDVATSSYQEDLHQNNIPTAGLPYTFNYDYDGNGNLIKDVSEHIANIVWTNDGKVKSILRDNLPIAGTNPAVYPPTIEYEYDASRQRVVKIVKPRSNGTNYSPQSSWVYTYYIRDATGQIMAIYEKTYDVISADRGISTYREKFVTKELDLYGSSRLGVDQPGYIDYGYTFDAGINSTTGEFSNIVYSNFTLVGSTGPLNDNNRMVGRKTFELSNHLGNVTTTISDRKIQSANTGSGAQVCNYNMTTLPGSTDLVYTNGNAWITSGQLICTPGTQNGATVFNIRLGTNLPANTTYQIEFDFDPGTLTGNDAIIAIAEDLIAFLPFCNTGPTTRYIFNGSSIPTAGHYTFYYKPDVVGSSIVTCLSFATSNAANSQFKIDNVTMAPLPLVTSYGPDVLNHTDYYAFGQPMPGRKWSMDEYRYGMNGQEKDNEAFKGAMTAEHWMYDSRIGRRWERDPITYEHQSPYATFNNNPIVYSDVLGLKGDDVIKGTWNEDTKKYDHKKVSKEYGPDVILTEYEGGAMDGKWTVESSRGKWTFSPRTDEFSIDVMIIHGKGGGNSNVFGGKYGGHVGVRIGNDNYGFSNQKHGSHLIAHGSRGRNSFFEKDNSDGGFPERWDVRGNSSVTHFSIPVSVDQFNNLKNAYETNVFNSKGLANSKFAYNVPYDYAIIGGRRCASSAYSMLTNANILEKKAFLADRAIHSLTPGQFYRYLMSTAKAQGWSIESGVGEQSKDKGFNLYERNVFDKIFDKSQ